MPASGLTTKVLRMFPIVASKGSNLKVMLHRPHRNGLAYHLMKLKALLTLLFRPGMLDPGIMHLALSGLLRSRANGPLRQPTEVFSYKGPAKCNSTQTALQGHGQMILGWVMCRAPLEINQTFS